MSQITPELVSTLTSLSPDDRIDLAIMLWESLDETVRSECGEID